MPRFVAVLYFLATFISATTLTADPWAMHVIDDAHRGADGVRLADFNGDGRPDIVTGWEESGLVRLYLNPGPQASTNHWPAVTVGRAASPEDAVPFDVDGDGLLDVVSCHEGKTRRLLVHLNRSDGAGRLLESAGWQTTEIRQVRGQAWMFAVPIQIGAGRSALAIGAKGNDASITLLTPPGDSPGDLSGWQAARLRQAGWIMSLRAVDVDGDGDQDLLYSDRKGRHRGVGWLEQPDRGDAEWDDHRIGGGDAEVMFLDYRLDEQSGVVGEILVSTRDSRNLLFRRTAEGWMPLVIANPDSVPHGKAIAWLSDDQIVLTANTHSGGVPKVPGLWLRSEADWQAIGEQIACKYDRIEVLDLNGDGQLDILTCEERQNLGVVWYENPGSVMPAFK